MIASLMSKMKLPIFASKICNFFSFFYPSLGFFGKDYILYITIFSYLKAVHKSFKFDFGAGWHNDLLTVLLVRIVFDFIVDI